MTAYEIAAAVPIICIAGMLQSAVGFGFALFSTPLLVWVGMPLPGVITLVATCALCQSALGAGRLRATVPWRLVVVSTLLRLLSLGVGLYLLTRMVAFSSEQIRAVVGGLLCLVVCIQILWRPTPAASVHSAWAGLAFVSSGLLSGLCGMGGPPLVLWVMAHDWSNPKTRGFLFAAFAATIPVQVLLLGLTFGPSILKFLVLGLALLPLVYLGVAIGLPLGSKIEKAKLRTLAYTILFCIGAGAVISSSF